LYLSLMFLQIGINPLAHPEPFLWVGFLWAALGGFLAALASVRSRHRLWLILFGDVGLGGTPRSRLVMSASGWLLVVLSHLLLVAHALYRIHTSYPFLFE
jgi:hypothetical protein